MHPTHYFVDDLDPGGTPRCYWCDCRPTRKYGDKPCPANPHAQADIAIERYENER